VQTGGGGEGVMRGFVEGGAGVVERGFLGGGEEGGLVGGQQDLGGQGGRVQRGFACTELAAGGTRGLCYFLLRQVS